MPNGVSLSRASEELLVVTFELGIAGVFGIDAKLIQEVVMVGEITPVHHAARYVAGIRNLRGRIITVIDLGLRLGTEPTEQGQDSRILIADCNSEPTGILVGRVGDTLSLESSELESVPANMAGAQRKQIRGVFRTRKRLVALLDLPLVLGIDHASQKATNGEDNITEPL